LRYVQNTPEDVQEMLKTIGVSSIDDLFSRIPSDLLAPPDLREAQPRGEGRAELRGPPFPARLSDPELLAHMRALAAKNVALGARPSFLGAGCYRHFIPPVVDALQSRGEFLTAYTPYQPEASQGSLQAFFEFQSMVCDLAGLDIANASLYDGATALLEAMVMVHAVKAPISGGATTRRKFLVSRGIHPEYRRTLKTYYANLPYQIEEIPLGEDGRTPVEEVRRRAADAVGLAFQSPSFYGTIEDSRALAEAAHAAGAVAVEVFDPHGVTILAPPGETGVDVACAEGQPLGNYPNFGGPHLGLLAARSEFLRRMPGRIVGQTKDLEGKTGYVLTLQTREQHIRRERATSNICTNVGLIALRATFYLACLGKEGLRDVARICLERAHYAADRIAALPGYALRYPKTPFYKEFAVRCPRPAAEVNRELAKRGITGGFDVSRFDPDAKDIMLIAVTEMNDKSEIDQLVAALKEIG
jgi:glycine dehydrogenase subunit 1